MSAKTQHLLKSLIGRTIKDVTKNDLLVLDNGVHLSVTEDAMKTLLNSLKVQVATKKKEQGHSGGKVELYTFLKSLGLDRFYSDKRNGETLDGRNFYRLKVDQRISSSQSSAIKMRLMNNPSIKSAEVETRDVRVSRSGYEKVDLMIIRTIGKPSTIMV